MSTGVILVQFDTEVSVFWNRINSIRFRIKARQNQTVRLPALSVTEVSIGTRTAVP